MDVVWNHHHLEEETSNLFLQTFNSVYYLTFWCNRATLHFVTGQFTEVSENECVTMKVGGSEYKLINCVHKHTNTSLLQLSNRTYETFTKNWKHPDSFTHLYVALFEPAHPSRLLRWWSIKRKHMNLLHHKKKHSKHWAAHFHAVRESHHHMVLWSYKGGGHLQRRWVGFLN